MDKKLSLGALEPFKDYNKHKEIQEQVKELLTRFKQLEYEQE